MSVSFTRWIAALALAGAAVHGIPGAAADPEPPPADPAPVAAPPAPPEAQAPPPGGGLMAGPVNPGTVVDAQPPLDPAIQALGPLGAIGGGGATHDQLTLGQRMPAPGDPSAPAPNTDLLSAGQFLNPTQYRVPGDDAENQYQLQPGTPGPFARVDGLKGLHAMLHGAMGRMPAPQLSEPLPGTAPPPGTNIPVGPVGNLDDPEAATAPVYGAPPAPGAPAPRLAQPAPAVDTPAG